MQRRHEHDLVSVTEHTLSFAFKLPVRVIDQYQYSWTDIAIEHEQVFLRRVGQVFFSQVVDQGSDGGRRGSAGRKGDIELALRIEDDFKSSTARAQTLVLSAWWCW